VPPCLVSKIRTRPRIRWRQFKPLSCLSSGGPKPVFADCSDKVITEFCFVDNNSIFLSKNLFTGRSAGNPPLTRLLLTKSTPSPEAAIALQCIYDSLTNKTAAASLINVSMLAAPPGMNTASTIQNQRFSIDNQPLARACHWKLCRL